MNLIAILIVMVVALLIAFLIETLVEYLFGTAFDKVPVLTPYKWTLMYVAMLVGIGAAFLYRLDLINLLSQYLSASASVTYILPITPFGMVITGAAIGRGSNYLHDIYDRFFKKQTLSETPAAPAS